MWWHEATCFMLFCLSFSPEFFEKATKCHHFSGGLSDMPQNSRYTSRARKGSPEGLGTKLCKHCDVRLNFMTPQRRQICVLSYSIWINNMICWAWYARWCVLSRDLCSPNGLFTVRGRNTQEKTATSVLWAWPPEGKCKSSWIGYNLQRFPLSACCFAALFTASEKFN